jgi:hypothetical protein
MEKILVAVDTNMDSFWSLVYALNLAKRIQVKISVLLVSPQMPPECEGTEGERGQFPIKNKIEKLIAEGRSSGIRIDYYNTSGSFKEEIIEFIQRKKIDLLVIEKQITKNVSELIEEIKLRTCCQIELVQPKVINS